MAAWLPTMSSIFTFVGGTLFGTLVSTWFNYYLKRPKIEIIGGGSGGGSNHIDIRNAPGLFGIKIRETIILGWSIHPQIEWGFVVDRNPAHECRAFLYDKGTNEMIKMLWWETYDQQLTQVITLHAGERAHLKLFAREAVCSQSRSAIKVLCFRANESNNTRTKNSGRCLAI